MLLDRPELPEIIRAIRLHHVVVKIWPWAAGWCVAVQGFGAVAADGGGAAN
jgi:hypothetical protein